MSSSRIPVWQRAIDIHHEFHGDVYGVLVKNEGYYPRLAKLLIHRRRSRTLSSKIQIEPVSSGILASNSDPVLVRTRYGERMVFADASGVFRVRIGEHVVHIVRTMLNASISVEYAIGTRDGMIALHKLADWESRTRRRSVPKKGLWNAYETGDRRVAYGRVDKEVTREALRYSGHPLFEELERDFEQFLSDLDWYTRYGQPGMRKILLSGPPGTGKTTLARALGAKHAERVVAVQCSNDSLITVCNEAAANRIPAILIAEEVDLEDPSAGMLSFLDGMHTPRNPAGTYIVFSTNYPKRIDPRIMKRPGRIDRVIPVGAFGRKEAAACARFFLPEPCAITDTDLGAALDRTTPAEIREIVVIATTMTRTRRCELDASVLVDARNFLSATLQEGVNVCDEDMDVRAERYRKLGPSPDYDSYQDSPGGSGQ